jgi:hypothetical protein
VAAQPEVREVPMDSLSTDWFRGWPFKMLSIILAIVAVCFLSELFSVLLNLPEGGIGVLEGFY